MNLKTEIVLTREYRKIIDLLNEKNRTKAELLDILPNALNVAFIKKQIKKIDKEISLFNEELQGL